MNYYILATALLVAGFAFLFVLREFILYLFRQTAKRKFRNRVQGIVGMNPRQGRNTLLHTVGKRIGRLSWSLYIANNRDAAEGIKEYAEIQGVDNSGDYIDTFKIDRMRSVHTYLKVIDWVRERRHINADKLYKRNKLNKERARKKSFASMAVLRLRNLARSISTSFVATIKFVHNTGGINDNDKHSNQIDQ